MRMSHTSFITNHCTKLMFLLLHVSATYCSHRQVATIIIRTWAAYCTSVYGNKHTLAFLRPTVVYKKLMRVYDHLPTYNMLLMSVLYYWLPDDGYNT